MIKKYSINILNENNDVISGLLEEEYISENDVYSLRLYIEQDIYYSKNDNLFYAFSDIRKQIFPKLPMCIASKINAFSTGMQMSMGKGTYLYNNIVIGKDIEQEDLKFIFDNTDEIDKLVHPSIQNIYFRIWEKSFYLNSKKLGFLDNVILIEKKKSFFFVYDKEKDLVYDILNKNDIHKFNNNTLNPKWMSFNDFINVKLKSKS